MSLEQIINNDCCLLTNIDLNSQRIHQLFERRFKSNSTGTSFDFKAFHPEQPSNNAKVSRSLLRFQPKQTFSNSSEDNLSTYSSSSEEDDEDEDDDEELSSNNDDYLNELAEWEPDNFQPIVESDDDKAEETNIFEYFNKDNDDDLDDGTKSMDHSIAENTSTTVTEDLFVTFAHRPIKTEQIDYDNNPNCDNPPQLDGQMDLLISKTPEETDRNDKEKNLQTVIDRIKSKTLAPSRVIQIHNPPRNQSRSSDERRKKTVNKMPKKTNSKPAPIKESPVRQSKIAKKPKSKLLNNVLKFNEDAIREVDIQNSLNQTNIRRTSVTSTSLNSTLHLRDADQQTYFKTSSNDEQQQTKSSSTNNKKKYILPTQKPKEKSASVHLALAERKLNYYQQSEQLTISTPKISHSNSAQISSSKKPKLADPMRRAFKTSKSVNSNVRNSEVKANAQISNDYPNKKLKKKKKKIKRLRTMNSNLSSTSQLQSTLSILKPNLQHDSSIVHKQTPLINQLSEPSISSATSNDCIKKRPNDFFDGCIVIDDDDDDDQQAASNNNQDDIQEIQQQQYSVSYDIRTREKLLDHAFHSSAMHIKWLFNVEYVLLEHIYVCHEKQIRPSNPVYDNTTAIKREYHSDTSYYSIDLSFVPIIIINFIKMFILRNSVNDQQELSFVQFGITSHLRYLLIELPTYNHNDERDSNDNCFKCHKYTPIINILFDLLFDLIEYDLCEVTSKTKYRSSLIEDDYFTRFLQSNTTKTQAYYRIRLIIYFIELIGLHMNKCQNKKQFQFNQNEVKLFHSIEDFIRKIISQTKSSTNQRISICFNVIELCLLFVNKKEVLMKQITVFLAELCENNEVLLNSFLFDKNLLADIRLLLINELIFRKFNFKLVSINHLNDLFLRVQENLNSIDPIDESILLILRGLFTSYADLVNEMKQFITMYSSSVQQLTEVLQNQLVFIFQKLKEIASVNSTYLEQTKRTLIFYRLLICRWNEL